MVNFKDFFTYKRRHGGMLTLNPPSYNHDPRLAGAKALLALV
jgi:hypothetical protein